jgi:hypothetical protein
MLDDGLEALRLGGGLLPLVRWISRLLAVNDCCKHEAIHALTTWTQTARNTPPHASTVSCNG